MLGCCSRRCYLIKKLPNSIHVSVDKRKQGPLCVVCLMMYSKISLQLFMSNHLYMATDGSNDIEDVKPNTDEIFWQQSWQSLNCPSVYGWMPCLHCHKIFEALDQDIKRRNVKWTNCVSFGADNASVMQGKTSGLASHLKKAKIGIPASGSEGSPPDMLDIVKRSFWAAGLSHDAAAVATHSRRRLCGRSPTADYTIVLNGVNDRIIIPPLLL